MVAINGMSAAMHWSKLKTSVQVTWIPVSRYLLQSAQAVSCCGCCSVFPTANAVKDMP